MILLAVISIAVPAAIAVASFLMIVACVGKKQVLWRSVQCPVCHHPRGSCTCRWL